MNEWGVSMTTGNDFETRGSPNLMKGIVVEKPHKYSLQKLLIPVLESGEALVKVNYVSFCGSDIGTIEGTMQDVTYPVVPGHEWSGTVVETNPASDNFIGKSIVADLQYPCGKCKYCVQGKGYLCRDLKEQGFNIDGAFAEYTKVSLEKIRILPPNIDLREACLIEPLCVALNAAKRVAIGKEDSVVIFGAGAIGLLILQIAKLLKAQAITLLDLVEERLQVGKILGATNVVNINKVDPVQYIKSLKKSPSVLVDASGSANVLKQALSIIEPGGRIGIVGNAASECTSLRPSTIMTKAIEIFGVLSPYGYWKEAINLIANGKINTNLLITHVFSLAEFERAFTIFSQRKDGAIRVLINTEMEVTP